MIFPPITIKATNIILTPQLELLLTQKFEPFGKLLADKGDTRCEIELEKITERQSGKIYRAEVNLFNNGKMYRTEATEEQIEQAIDTARNELKHELQHAYGKKRSLVKKGQQMIKNMMRFGRKE